MLNILFPFMLCVIKYSNDKEVERWLDSHDESLVQ